MKTNRISLILALAFLVVPAPAARQEIVQPPLRHEVSVRLVLVDPSGSHRAEAIIPIKIL